MAGQSGDAPSQTPTTTTRLKKRKATEGIDQEKTRPAKQPRKTLDAFFNPRVQTSAPAKSASGETELAYVKQHVELNEEQRCVLNMVVNEGKSVFFTGAAGTGKSLLLRAIISSLRRKHAKKPDSVAVTASTGMAASSIGGTTIHAWGAVTPGTHNIDKLISYIRTCRPAYQRWKATRVLVIDEVSMVDGHLFDTLAKLAVELRRTKADQGRPFGGIQLVITGDFFQLPPVTKSKQEPFFAFQSEAWKTCISHVVALKQVFRQKDDHFVRLLNEMRKGEISPEARRTFVSLSRPLTFTDDILPTELFPTRTQVEEANALRLTSLTTPSFVCEAYETGPASPEKCSKLLEHMPAPRVLELKAGAQVMLVKNIDERAGLVNGSVGRVLGFWNYAVCKASALSTSGTEADVKSKAKATETTETEKDKSASTSTPAGKSKLPAQESAKLGGFVRQVRLGLDGCTPIAYVPLSSEGKENSGTPEKKHAETLLSPWKPKHQSGVSSVPGSPSRSKSKSAKSSAADKDKTKTRSRADDLFPLVAFPSPSGVPGEFEAVLVVRDEFRVEDAEGNLLARRVQVPLMLAWAMSIHKAQGQTIQRVKVDLGRVFERGQSYVAISRASSVEGLQVLRFDAKKVMAHPKVIEWSKQMEMEEEGTATFAQLASSSAA